MSGWIANQGWPRLHRAILLVLWMASVCIATGAALGISDIMSAHLRNAASRSAQVIEANVAPMLARGDTLEINAKLRSVVHSTGLSLMYIAIADPSGRVVGAASRGLPRPDSGEALTAAYARKLGWLLGGVYSKELQFQTLPVGQVDFVVAYPAAWAPQNGGGGRFLLLALIALAISGHLIAYLTPRLGADLSGWKPHRDQEHLLRRAAHPSPQTPNAPAAAAAAPVPAETHDSVLKAACDAMGAGIIISDVRNRIRYMNHAAEQLLGWGLREAQDKPIFAVLRTLDEKLDPVPSPAERCQVASSPRESAEVVVRTRSGEPVPVLIESVVVGDGRERSAIVTSIANRTGQQSRLRAAESQAYEWSTAADAIEDGLLWLDGAGIVESANAPAARMLGYAREELSGKTLGELFPVPFQDRSDTVPEAFLATLPPDQTRPPVVARRQGSGTFPVDFKVHERLDGGLRRLLVQFRNQDDIHRRESLRERIGRALDAAADEIYVLDAATLRIEDASARAGASLGYPLSELRGMSYLRIARELDPRQFESFMSEMASGRRTRVSVRTLHTRKDGQAYPVDLRLGYAPSGTTPWVVALAQDVSEQEQSEARLHFLAHHDPLTGLPNRSLLMDRLQQAMHAADRSRRMLALIFVDLDKFKQVNDTLGHEFGDLLLKAVADRLRRSVRSADTVARLSGDEFTLIIGGLTGRDDVVALVEQLLGRLDEPVEASGKQMSISASLGITLYPSDRGRPEELLQHADLAMYEAKQEGGRRYHFYEQSLNEQIRQRASQQAVLRAALTAGQLSLVFEPVVSLADGRIAYIEVHGCWERAVDQPLAGAELLDLVRRLRLSVYYDEWLMQAALGQAGAWTEAGVRHVPLIITPALMRARHPEWVDGYAAALKRVSVDPARTVLDVSGSGLIEDFAAGEAFFSRLHELGVKLCASDAAPGVTDAVRLAKVPLEMLWLDAASLESPKGGSGPGPYGRAMLGMAAALSVPVAVRRVDTAERLALVRQAGCKYAQGTQLHATLRAVELIARLRA